MRRGASDLVQPSPAPPWEGGEYEVALGRRRAVGAPEVPARDGAPRAPRLAHAEQLFFGRWARQAERLARTAAEHEVIDGEHVWSAELHEQQLGGPASDAADRDEAVHHLLVAHPRHRAAR